MFELIQRSARIAHVNLREEKHGEDDVLAADLKIEAKLANDFLNQLHADLKASLYSRGDGLDLGDDHVAKLRYPLLGGPLHWDGAIVGGKVTLHAPVSDDDLTVFADVDNLRISPQDGGTVVIVFRVKVRPDGDQAARLPFLLGKLVEISVQKPVVEQEDDLASDPDDSDPDDC